MDVDDMVVWVAPLAIVRVALVAGAVMATLLTDVAVAAPMLGVVRLGLVANTAEPDPVSSVSAAARFALVGVPRNVVTPVPRPLTPVEIGKPVAFVSVPLTGVPRAGVTRMGEFERTTDPVPVELVVPVPPFGTPSVPVTPVVNGKPVALVRVTADGVPRLGTVSIGAVSVLLVRVCASVVPTMRPAGSDLPLSNRDVPPTFPHVAILPTAVDPGPVIVPAPIGPNVMLPAW